MVREGAAGCTLERLNHLENVYKSYIREAKEMCERVWAKFDLRLTVTGFLTIGVGVSLGFYFLLVWGSSEEKLPTSAKFLLGGSLLHLFYLAVHMSFFPETVPPLMAVVLAVMLIFATLIFIRNSDNIQNADFRKYFTFDNVISSVILGLNCCIYFSNSFIVYESIISLFFVQTIICVFFLKILVNNYLVQRKEVSKPDFGRHSRKLKANFDLFHIITQPTILAFIITLMCCAILRIVLNFHSCREEQHLCKDSIFILPLSSLQDEAKNQRYMFSVFCISTVVYAFRYWLKHYGNLNGTHPGVICMCYGPPLSALFISLHWALQALPQSSLESFTQWQQVLMAQMVYVITLIVLTVLIVSPLMVYTLPGRADPSIQVLHQGNL